MLDAQELKQSRGRAANRRDWSQVEQYLTEYEKAHGCPKAWALRERFERGDVTLADLRLRGK